MIGIDLPLMIAAEKSSSSVNMSGLNVEISFAIDSYVMFYGAIKERMAFCMISAKVKAVKISSGDLRVKHLSKFDNAP
jgi:hypothetical protein